MTTRAWLLALLLTTGCAAAEARDTRVRTALDILAEVIDPAYSMAVDGCIASQGLAVQRGEQGVVTKDEARADVRAIQARCAVARKAFDVIRLHHHQAAELVERGAIRKAEAELNKVRAVWRELQKDQPP